MPPQVIVPALPQTPEEIFRQACALKEAGDLQAAILEFENALDAKPEYKEAAYNLGNTHREMENTGLAIAAWRRTLEIDPKFKAAHVNLGIALRAQGNLNESIEHHKSALELDSKCLEACINLGVALATRQSRGDFTQAAFYYDKAIEINPSCKVAHYNQGLLLKNESEFDSAEAAFKKAIAIEPEDPMPHCRVAELQLVINNQEIERAQTQLGLGNRRASGEELKLSDMLDLDETDKRLEMAQREYSIALEADAGCAEAYVGLGLVKLAMSERYGYVDNHDATALHMEAARVAFAEVLARWPEDVMAHRKMGHILCTTGHTKEALVHWEFVLEREPDNCAIRNLAGQACKKFGLVKDALRHYRTALETDPEYDWWFKPN